jgi:hypothetical protein
MIVALSGIGEQGISGDVSVPPGHIGASTAIGRSACAIDIVEPNDRRILVDRRILEGGGATVETDLSGVGDYYVIDQCSLPIESIGKDAGTS